MKVIIFLLASVDIFIFFFFSIEIICFKMLSRRRRSCHRNVRKEEREFGKNTSSSDQLIGKIRSWNEIEL